MSHARIVGKRAFTLSKSQCDQLFHDILSYKLQSIPLHKIDRYIKVKEPISEANRKIIFQDILFYRRWSNIVYKAKIWKMPEEEQESLLELVNQLLVPVKDPA